MPSDNYIHFNLNKKYNCIIEKMKKELKILVTGSAGFIGFHVTQKFLEIGANVIGIDNLNSYYDVNLKKDRLKQIKSENFTFIEIDFSHKDQLLKIFKNYGKFDRVIHLGAQAGVRHSITNPFDYVNSNLVGFVNILEACRNFEIEHLIYASSSSVYGMNKTIPFSEKDFVDHPVSLYAATKKSNELIAHSYSHLYGLPTTGLRFFTVYGPWGRPDMAYFLFAEAIIKGENIDIFNNGEMERDFTYIDDVVNGIVKVSEKPLHEIDQSSKKIKTPYQIFNIGNNKPIKLTKFVEIIENAIRKKAKKNFLPMQPGDVKKTYADIESLYEKIGYKPETKIEDGLIKFIDWFMDYYDYN